MGIRVLGPMELGAVTLGARERTILSALIVRRGEALRPAELAAASWGDALPPTWQQQIRNSVARIRTRLGPDAVVTVTSAYRLGLDPDSIDAVRFERLVSAARAHALQSEDARAIDAYRRALGLWRGRPLQDVADWEPAETEARRLLEIRASAEEEFFGRDAEGEEVLARLAAGSITAVTGPSGSGKSSLVLAGIVPRLHARGRRVHVMRPGSAGAAELRRIVDEAAADALVIDQAEELLHDGGAELEAFCQAAERFLAAGGTVLLTLRSDFLDEAAALPSIGTPLARGVYVLPPLSREAMRAAITEPAARAGLRLEPGLVELVLRDAADRASTLPPLSHAMQETWVRREGVTLTVAGYEAAGGISGAIAQSAENLYQRLGDHDRDLCRALMLRLVERADDGLPVRRRITMNPIIADPQRRAVVEALVDSRLVVADGGSLQVAHEAVATAWPRLVEWLETDADGARLMRQVASAAEAWDTGGRRDDDLLRGARLQSALEWAGATDPDLTDRERAFLDASDARQRAETEALTARAVRDRRQNTRLRWALAGAGVLLVASVVSSGLAVVRGNDATAAAEEALIQAVTSTSGSLLDTNWEVAALLAVEAYRHWPEDPRSAHARMGVMAAAGPLVANTFASEDGWRFGMWPIPHTTYAAVVRDNTQVEIRDRVTGALVRALGALEDTDQLIRPWVRVGSDGSTIAVIQHAHEPADGPGADDLDHARDEIAHFFDVATGERIGAPVHADDLATGAVLNADGSLLVWAFMGRVTAVERDSGTIRTSAPLIPELLSPDDQRPRSAAAFTGDGSIVATTIADEALILDPGTLEVRRRFPLPPGSGGRRHRREQRRRRHDVRNGGDDRLPSRRGGALESPARHRRLLTARRIRGPASRDLRR